jgi:hypothetical protein
MLPIAHFECLQKSNWPSGTQNLDTHQFCELVYPIKIAARNTPLEVLVGADYILYLRMYFSQRLGWRVPPEFRNSRDWKEFLNEWTVEFRLEEKKFSEASSYVLAILFHQHLTTLGLLTSWTIVDVLGGHMGRPPLRKTKAVTQLSSFVQSRRVSAMSAQQRLVHQNAADSRTDRSRKCKRDPGPEHDRQ